MPSALSCSLCTVSVLYVISNNGNDQKADIRHICQLNAVPSCDADAADQACGIAAEAVCASVLKPERSKKAEGLCEDNTGKNTKGKQKALKGRTRKSRTAEANGVSELGGSNPAASQQQDSSNGNRKAARQSARGGPAEGPIKSPRDVQGLVLRGQQGFVAGRGKAPKAACFDNKENQVLVADS